MENIWFCLLETCGTCDKRETNLNEAQDSLFVYRENVNFVPTKGKYSSNQDGRV